MNLDFIDFYQTWQIGSYSLTWRRHIVAACGPYFRLLILPQTRANLFEDQCELPTLTFPFLYMCIWDILVSEITVHPIVLQLHNVLVPLFRELQRNAIGMGSYHSLLRLLIYVYKPYNIFTVFINFYIINNIYTLLAVWEKPFHNTNMLMYRSRSG